MNANPTIKGIAFIVTASVVFCLMSSLIKYASNIDSFIITLVRFAIGLALLGTAGLFGVIKLKFVYSWFLLLRGLTAGISTFIFFLSISRLGIAKATVICYSFPIFATIFSLIFLRERIGILKALAILTAFGGIYLLATDNISGTAFLANLGRYEILAVFGAIFGGIAITLVKKLHATDSSYAIYFAQCVIGFWLLVIPANAASSDIGYSGAFVLLCIGVMATVGQLFMIQGYKYLPVSTGSSLMMLVPVLNYAIGIIVFRELFSLCSIIGTAIVLSSCAVVISADNNHTQKCDHETAQAK